MQLHLKLNGEMLGRRSLYHGAANWHGLYLHANRQLLWLNPALKYRGVSLAGPIR
jgi:hypothetical protein